ncbi:MAG: zinc-ribbon domain-containing protein [Solirubrobacteraceae bacterium]
MLFLFFGYGTKVRDRGEAGVRDCPRCHNRSSWRLIETWRYLSLFFVPLLRWHRERLEVCPICSHAEPAELRARQPLRRIRRASASAA